MFISGLIYCYVVNPFLRVKELSSTFGQVDKLEKVKKEIEQTVLSLETK